MLRFYLDNGDHRHNWAAWRNRAGNRDRYRLGAEHEAIWRAFGKAQQTRNLQNAGWVIFVQIRSIDFSSSSFDSTFSTTCTRVESTTDSESFNFATKQRLRIVVSCDFKAEQVHGPLVKAWSWKLLHILALICSVKAILL